MTQMTENAKSANPKTHKLVRINPGSPREVHVFQGYHFKKADGWYGIPNAVADACEKEPLHEGNPATSPRIFEVKTVAEANNIAEAERAMIEPPGTPDKPKMIEPARGAARETAPVDIDAPSAEALRRVAADLSDREKEIVIAGRELDDREEAAATRERDLARREEALKTAETKAVAEKAAEPPPPTPKPPAAVEEKKAPEAKVTTGPKTDEKKK